MLTNRNIVISVLLVVATSLVCVAASTAGESESSRGRPATLDDLAGTWRLVDMQLMRKFNRLDPFVLPYQRYHFTKQGKMKAVTSGTPFKQKLLDIFARRDPVNTFQLSPDSVLTITGKAWRSMNRCHATVLTGAEDLGPELGGQSGDLILTWLSSNGQPNAIKVLRKVN